MPQFRAIVLWGMSFQINKQLLTGGFQRRMTSVRQRAKTYDFHAVSMT